ncbi:hypothetical protein CLV63_11059 [Murinocardiopsis flavida]|uniref:DNA-binding protein n=1 Tax=Murinocardiopsis flavida TaxID=645275 RepID=A0A2P8DHR4_9ACTN|nr:hypothetical protein [Murinocardiopsis flavida]PSK96762.1 hypothetical protein CLV63_11059 [Murinocardiopsis flavida]
MSTASGPGAALLDAGLAPLGSAPGGEPVRARRYTHPALGDRPVVRLAGDTRSPAEDAVLGFFGFGAPAASAPLALGSPQGLGYPEWALVHDPANAGAALAAVDPLQRAARMARSRPGAAADAFTALAATLPHGHLPAFWEQAGRAFLAAESTGQAAAMFGRAREAEQVHALPVDEATRRDVFLEFAFAGALTVKALSGYAAELAGRYPPERAYTEFWELALRRTLGGLPPWAELPKQLRGLAAAAGHDPGGSADRALGELIELPATAAAAAGFWKGFRPALLRLAKADAGLRRTLLGLFPRSDANGFREWWLGLLDASGALDLVADPAADVPGGAAAWFARLSDYVQVGRWRMPAGLYALVPRVAGRLIADAVPVPIDKGGEHGGAVDADLLDACLAHGVPVVAPRALTRVNLTAWLAAQGGAPQRDLASAVADPAWRARLAAALAEHGEREGIDAFLAFPALAPLVGEHLTALIDGFAAGGWRNARRRIDRLESEIAGPALDAFGAQRDALAGADLAPVLGATLRAGVHDEYGWQALDDAARELVGDQPVRPPVHAAGTWPILTLCTSAKAIAVGPCGRVAEHTLRLPGGAVEPRAAYVPTGPVDARGAAPGEFLVAFRLANEWSFYWSHDPADIVKDHYAGLRTMSDLHLSYGSGSPLAGPDGGRIETGHAIRPGDRGGRLLHRFHGLLFDGATVWRGEFDRHPNEVDPATGAAGRTSLPAFLAAQPAGGAERLMPRYSTLAPLPAEAADSPLGAAGGLAGFAVFGDARPWHERGAGPTGFRIVGADGAESRVALSGIRSSGGAKPFGHLAYPGGARHVLVHVDKGVELHAADGTGPLWRVGFGDHLRRGPVRFVPEPMFWHFLRPRDPRASAVLRAVGDERARALLDAAIADLDARADREVPAGSLPATEKLVEELLGADAHPAVADGVLDAVEGVAKVARRRTAFLTRGQREREAAPAFDPALLGKGLGDLVQARGRLKNAEAELRRVAAFLGGELAPDAMTGHGDSGLNWAGLTGRIGAAAWLAALPSTGDGVREALTAFLRLWSTTPFADPAADLAFGVVLRRGKKAVFEAVDGRRRADVWESFFDRGLFDDRAEEGKLRYFIEVGTSGTPLPPHGDDIVLRRAAADLRWGTAAQIGAVLDQVAAHGPIPWDPDAVGVLSERTGLGRGAAAQLLAGWPRGHSWAADFLGKDLRGILGVTAAEARIGQSELGQGGLGTRRDVLASVFPDPEAEIAALWRPGGMRTAAERIADAWVEQFGRKEPIAEATLALAAGAGLGGGLPAMLAALRAPESSAPLTTEARARLVGDSGSRPIVRYEDEATERLPDIVSTFAALIPWAYAELPVGDPVRAGIPAALRLLRARLADPGLLFKACFFHTDKRIADLFGTEPYRAPGGAEIDGDVRDDGLTVAAAGRYDITLFMRPALLGHDARSTALRAATEQDPYGVRLPARIDLLRSDGFTAIAERVAAAGGGTGAGCESDPAVAVPALAAEAAGHLGVSADAARLYLQYLALLEPTDANVKRWNGWTSARLRAAGRELADHGLVVSDKRARAGRSLFLPGGWLDAKAPNKPFEAAKCALYGLVTDTLGRPSGPHERFAVLRPLPEIFAQAWAERDRQG